MLTWWVYCILIEPGFIELCDLYSNGFQFIKSFLFNFFFEHINKNHQQISTFSKYSCHVWKGGYQPLRGVSVKKQNNELEYKMLLIWNVWQSGNKETIKSGHTLLGISNSRWQRQGNSWWYCPWHSHQFWKCYWSFWNRHLRFWR